MTACSTGVSAGSSSNRSVMAGLVPAIHVYDTVTRKDVDARDKPGHDDLMCGEVGQSPHQSLHALDGRAIGKHPLGQHALGDAEMIAQDALDDRAQIGGRREVAAFIKAGGL
jgi:hypothetical protein